MAIRQALQAYLVLTCQRLNYFPRGISSINPYQAFLASY